MTTCNTTAGYEMELAVCARHKSLPQALESLNCHSETLRISELGRQKGKQ